MGLAGAIPSGLTIQKVVDTNTPLPGATNTTGGFLNPSWDGREIAFIVYQHPFERYALFKKANGILERIATNNETSLPNDQGRISILGDPNHVPLVHHGTVWLEVLLTNSTSTKGVIESSSANLKLAMSNIAVDALVGEVGHWFSGNEARLTDDGHIVRMVHGDRKQWLVSYDGTKLGVINDAPGLRPAEIYSFNEWAVYSEGFAVMKINTKPSFFREHLGETQILDSGLKDLFPISPYITVDSMDANGGWVAIQTRDSELGSTRYSIYGWSAGKWFPIAVPGDALVDGSLLGNFSDTSVHSIYQNSLLVEAMVGGKKAIVLCRAGELYPMVRVGDVIDGETVSGVGISRYALQGDAFVFQVIFQSGRCGVYTADFSAVVPNRVEKLEMEFLSGSGKRGKLEIHGDRGFTYHLRRSEDFKSSRIVESRSGTDEDIQFDFDDSNRGVDHCFFWIERAKY